MDVAVVTSHCRRHCREMPLCPFYGWHIEVRGFVRTNGWRPSDGFLGWRIGRR